MPDRTACRLLFVACCLLPTTLVMGWAVAVHCPAYLRGQRRELEQQLTDHLGLEAKCDSYWRRRDGSLDLGDVQLRGPDGRPLLTATEVRVRFEKKGWTVDCEQIQLNRDDVGRLWEAIDHRWLRDASASQRQLRLAANTARIAYNAKAARQDADSEGVYEGITIDLRAADELRSCELRLKQTSPTALPAAPVECIVTEDANRQVTHLKLLAKAGLPARLLSPDLVEFVGDDCTVFGQVHAIRDGGTWTARVVDSQLANVNLSQLCPQHLTLTGMGQITVGQAQFVDGRLNVAEGLLSGATGQVAPQTLQSLARYLEVEPAAHPDRPMLLDYAQLSVEFKLHSAGLDLKGNCPIGEHVILVDHRGEPLLRSRAYWARRERVLRGLMMSAVEPDAVGRRAPYPVMARIAAELRR